MKRVLLVVALTACSPTAPPPPPTSPASAPVAAAAASAPASAPVVRAKPIRRFLKVEGDVKLDGKAVVAGDEIPATGKLTTAKGARAVLTLEVGGVIEVRENASVDIGASPKRKISLKLLAGAIWSLLPRGKSDYEVVTPNAVAGARGTTFFVTAQKDDLSMVCVCDGDVELHEQHVVTHEEHWGYRIAGKGKKAKPKLIGKKKDMDNHPNAQQAVLRALLD